MKKEVVLLPSSLRPVGGVRARPGGACATTVVCSSSIQPPLLASGGITRLYAWAGDKVRQFVGNSILHWRERPPLNSREEQHLAELHDLRSTPEEGCGTRPKHLPTGRKQWQQMCRHRAHHDALFPASKELRTRPQPPLAEDMALPRIPGSDVEAVHG